MRPGPMARTDPWGQWDLEAQLGEQVRWAIMDCVALVVFRAFVDPRVVRVRMSHTNMYVPHEHVFLIRTCMSHTYMYKHRHTNINVREGTHLCVCARVDLGPVHIQVYCAAVGALRAFVDPRVGRVHIFSIYIYLYIYLHIHL